MANIWVIKTGESNVFVNHQESMKLGRAANVAQRLSRRGHDVTWWTGKFLHHSKKFLDIDSKNQSAEYPQVRLISSPGYNNNVSLKRFYDHWKYAKNLEVAFDKADPPDVIFCAFPTIDNAKLAVEYGAQHDVPVIVDVRDLWPDFIYNRLAMKLGIKVFPKLLFTYERSAQFAITNADSVVGMSEGFVNWACKRFGRRRKRVDKGFYLSSESLGLSENYSEDSISHIPINRDQDVLKILMVGTLMNQQASKAVYDAIESLPDELHDKLQFIICGSGELHDYLKRIASSSSYLIAPGWINFEQYSTLAQLSDLGMILYDPVENFELGLPNKVGEYTSAGLSVLTTFGGEVEKVLPTSNHFMFKDLSRDKIVQMFRKLHEQKNQIRENKVISEKFYESTLTPQKVYESLSDHIESFTYR